MSFWNPLDNWRKLRSKQDDEAKPQESYVVGEGDDTLGEQELMSLGLLKPIPMAGVTPDIDHVRVSGEYVRSIYISEYPGSVRPGWLDKIFQFPEAIDISMYVEPWDRSVVMKKLRDRVLADETKLIMDREKRAITDFKTQERYRRNMHLLEKIQNRDTFLFSAGILITMRAPTLKQLDSLTEKVEREFQSPTKTTCPEHQQLNAYLTSLPLCNRKLGNRKQMMKRRHTASLMAMFPFSVGNMTHPNGVWLGVNEKNGGNVILNRFLRERGLSNPHQMVIGFSGSGKSYLTKAEIYQYRMLRVPVVVIDPLNEYQKLCGNMGGSFVPLSLGSEMRINPLDFSHAVVDGTQGDELGDKIAAVISLIGIMLRTDNSSASQLSATQKANLEKALKMAYRKYGYRSDSPESFSKERALSSSMPTLGELYDILVWLSKRGDDQQKKAIRPMLDGLSSFVGDGTFAGLFDHRSNVKLDNPFIVFNLLDVPDLLLPPVMQMVLDFLRTSFFTMKQKLSGQRRLFYVDEAHRLMGNPESAQFLAYMSRTARQFNVGMTVISQDVETFNQTDVGKTILGMMTTKIIMLQQSSKLPGVQKAFDLTNGETNNLQHLKPAQSLIIAGPERAWVNHMNILSPHAHKLAESQTNVSDLGEIHGSDDSPPALPPA